MVRNKLRWDANDAVGLPKQRKVGLDWYEFLCFGSPTASFASQRNLFRTYIHTYNFICVSRLQKKAAYADVDLLKTYLKYLQHLIGLILQITLKYL